MEKLVAVARQGFDYVVIDAGSRFDLSGTTLVERRQYGVPGDAGRYPGTAQFASADFGIFQIGSSNLEIVLNRFMPRSGGVDEEHIAKALTRPVQWKIPSDYVTVRRMQNEATPLALEDTQIARAIQDMARTACGMPAKPEKKKGFSLFG